MSQSHSLEGTGLGRVLAEYVAPQWYLRRYPDVAAAGMDPVLHFIRAGAADGRDPNPFFDSTWYRTEYADVADSGTFPLLHYLFTGAAERRDPHPRFDAEYYAAAHPQAAANPLLFHLRFGRAQGYPTEKPFQIADYLPSTAAPSAVPAGIAVDVIVPVYRGLAETRRCLDSVLADTAPSLGRVIVIDDRSPEPELVAWLRTLDEAGQIILLRNRRSLGFVASVNRGMEAAGDNDVVLLNSDTEVPPGWLHRLAAQAYAAPRIASVSPFSNNATICGYPYDVGGTLTFGHTLQQIDDVCRTVNAGRFVELPMTVGFCMYIRRAALRDVGTFDPERFPHGHGEDTDFCLSAAAKGWTHRLSCDVFVHHEGRAGFGERRRKVVEQARDQVVLRFPDYPRRLAKHVRRGAATPYRFAITAALLQRAELPVILTVANGAEGNVRRHLDGQATLTCGQAHIVLLEEIRFGYALSVPLLPGHPTILVPADRQGDLETLLRSAGISRFHIHDLPPSVSAIRDLIRQLGVPFDVTLNDYEGLCPQRTMQPWPEGLYCGEPGPGVCNACIADSVDRDHGARDILSWRLERAWMFLDADRVFCPSEDARQRLRRYGLGDRAVLAPPDNPPAGDWAVAVPAFAGGALRVALLGILSHRNGAQNVVARAAAMASKTLALRLIGHADESVPAWARKLIQETGPCAPDALGGLIRRADPHVIWFPATWPAPYCAELTAAIDSGLPIVAPDLGVFSERLRGRKLTWLVHYRASAAELLAVFEDVRQTLQANSAIPAAARLAGTAGLQATDGLQPAATSSGRASAERPVIVALAEREADGSIAANSYVRLLQPLDHPAVAGHYRLVLGRADTITEQVCQAIILRPGAVPDLEAAGIIARHARDRGIRLIVDLDEDHPDRDGSVSDLLIQKADAIWVSTESRAAVQPKAVLMESRLDERLWLPATPAQAWADPIVLVWMGSPQDAEDFAMLEPTLVRLRRSYDERVAIKALGLPLDYKPQDGIDVIHRPPLASSAYPSFVHWLGLQAASWHIGLAPMTDAPVNRFRSSIRVWEYAALGLPVLASDVPAYRGSPAEGRAGELVTNTPAHWYAAMERLIRNPSAWSGLGTRGRSEFEAGGSLGSVADSRRRALDDLLAEHLGASGVLRRVTRRLDNVNELPGTASRTRRRSGRG